MMGTTFQKGARKKFKKACFTKVRHLAFQAARLTRRFG